MAGDVYDFAGLCAILMLFTCVLADEPKSLYSESDDVAVLTHINLKKLIHASDSAWFVEFYNSWCGHCIRFAPTWKELGTDVKGWEPALRIGAVDCATKENAAVCSDYDIHGYPTIKTFPAHAAVNFTGDRYDGGTKLYEMRHEMINYLQSNKSGLSDEHHHLRPLQDLNEIWKDVGERTEHTVVIFEEKDSFLGREVILDVASHGHLLVRRMLKPDVIKYGISRFPSAHLIDKKIEGKFTKIAALTDRKGFKAALMALLGLQETEGAGDGSEVKEELAPETPAAKINQQQIRFGGSVHMQDLLSGIHYSLRQEVAGYKLIQGEALEALKKYTDVLAKYFPGDAAVVEYLRGLHMWIHDKPEPIHVKTWTRALDDLQSSSVHLPAVVRWTGCSGSKSQFRGYPCSLWTLFHTLTATAAAEHSQDPGYDPQEVLLAMRAYITNFFGCQECRENFNRGAVHIEAKVTSADDAILFLWRSHNRANYNLKGDPSEDPIHPKLQFPPPELCPQCHLPPRADTDAPQWAEPEVLKYLRRMYARENIVQDAVTEEKYADMVEEEERNARPANDWRDLKLNLNRTHARDVTSRVSGKVERWKRLEYDTRFKQMGSGEYGGGFGMNGTDLSICILFYIICTLIIILLCFHFTVQKRMRLNLCRKNMILPL